MTLGKHTARLRSTFRQPNARSSPASSQRLDHEDHSLEKSAQEWLQGSDPDYTQTTLVRLLEPPCRCCGKNECEQLDALSETVRKLEQDARLAAEIGQGLLHKHESYVVESSTTKSTLEKQASELNDQVERTRSLEEMLGDADATQRKLQDQLDKSQWENKKSQKTLREIENDLVSANTRCVQLAQELKDSTAQVEKLRIFKFMVKQTDAREEMLRSKLDDIHQELTVSRKNELTLEARLKKLKAQHESLTHAYRRLQHEEYERKSMTNDSDVDSIEDLKQSNEKLRQLAAALLSPPCDPGHIHDAEILSLIKDLLSTNNKLKDDLIDRKVLLPQGTEVLLDDETDDGRPQSRQSSESSLLAPPAWLSTSVPLEDTAKNLPRDLSSPLKTKTTRRNTSSSPVRPKGVIPSPTTSSSLPTSKPDVVHHHYHYYPQRKHDRSKTAAAKPMMTRENITAAASESLTLVDKDTEIDESCSPPTITVSPTSSVKLAENRRSYGSIDMMIQGPCPRSSDTPFHHLHVHVSQALDRLRATDVCAMNRQLRRAFDLADLSQRSNATIQDVLHNLGDVSHRYVPTSPVESAVNPWTSKSTMDAFVPIAQLLQDMLSEIGNLRVTINDLQVDYVSKLEDRTRHAEQESTPARSLVLSPSTRNPRTATIGTLTWLSSVFQRLSTQVATEHIPRQPSPPSARTSPLSGLSQRRPRRQPLGDALPASDAPLTMKNPLVVRRKRSDLDRHAMDSPPRGSDLRRSSTIQARVIPTRRRLSSSGTSSPAAREPVLRRQRSLLHATSYMDHGSSFVDSTHSDWPAGGTVLRTGWLGNSSLPSTMEHPSSRLA